LLTCCSDVEQQVEFIEQISFNLDYRTVFVDCAILNASVLA
jgi:hypothetical protein